MITYQDYCVADPDALETPTMLLFQDMMDHNIRSVCEMVGGGQNLIAHVKTHKSEAVARKQVEAGIDGFKCATLKELETVLQAGARKAILSYPQVQERKIERLCDLASSYPGRVDRHHRQYPRFTSTCWPPSPHAENSRCARCWIWMPACTVRELDSARMPQSCIGKSTHTSSYSHPDFTCTTDTITLATRFNARRQRSETSSRFGSFSSRSSRRGCPFRAWSPAAAFSFAYYARTEGMYGSPGTFIYWDAGFSTAMPDIPFRCAALILTQVVDRYPDAGTITTDLGYKGISGDLPVEGKGLLAWPGRGATHIAGRRAWSLPDLG